MTIMEEVSVQMAYDQAVQETERLDERTDKVTYIYPEEIRKEIQYIREKYRRDAYNLCVKVFGKHFTTPDKKDTIREIVGEANRQMNEIEREIRGKGFDISNHLYAQVIFTPIYIDELKSREYYDLFYYKVMETMMDSIKHYVKQWKSDLPTPKSQQTIKDLIGKFERLNVLDDERIDKKLDEMRNFVNMTTKEIKQELDDDMNWLNNEIEKMMLEM